MQSRIKYFFVFVLTLLLFLPAIQFLFRFPEIKNTWLAGKVEEVSKPKFTAENWLNEIFQKHFAAYLEANAGYKPWLVRLTNEWQFRLFKDADNNVVVGDDDWLYAKPYIETFIGKDLENNDALLKRIARTKYMQTLFDSVGKQCLFILAPGKASYAQEHIPETFLQKRNAKNNYTLLKTDFEKEGVEHIDFYNYFLSKKATTPYPLFPKFGTHWSLYGAFVANDSIAKYINRKSKWVLDGYKLNGIEISKQPRGTDKDLLDLMNLFSDLPSPALAYPKVIANPSSSVHPTPTILVVGDSYMWTLYQCGVMPYIANKKSAYWYYGNTVYNYDIQPTGVEIKNLNLKEELNNYDVVLFVFTETDMINFDFNMTEKFISALEKPQ